MVCDSLQSRIRQWYLSNKPCTRLFTLQETQGQKHGMANCSAAGMLASKDSPDFFHDVKHAFSDLPCVPSDTFFYILAGQICWQVA